MAVVAFKVLLMSAIGSMFPLAVIAMVKRPNNTVNSTDCPINTNINVTVTDSGGNENGEFDWDELTQSYIFAVGGVGTLMSMLIGARLCELYGVKFVVGISMVITAVLTLLSPSAARLTMILGTLIPMFTAGELMEKFGWPSVYYLSGLSVIPFMITWVFLVYDTPHHHPTISNEEKSYIIKNSQRDYGSSFISALPHLANLASNVLCSTLSHWLRMKGIISQLTAYRIFNFFATIGTAVAMIVVAQLGCNAEATVSVLVLTMTLNGAYFGGSFMNLLDLGSNFSGSLSAYSGTLIGTMTIVAPLITGAIINTNQTRSSWGNVFYVSAAVSTLPFFIFFFLGSVEEQPWNIIHKEEDEEAIAEVGPEDETNAYDPEH
ncbi:unnamed protein product [Timema podura]|uniref:Major facilitator superfamily (MFS) profile domain-containing protein n=1 Tax=Timema podura TaxID=61482 RepID=A0ABN7NKD1_TIMPD|nr:unnamed protein product [Timema podura]